MIIIDLMCMEFIHSHDHHEDAWHIIREEKKVTHDDHLLCGSEFIQ